MMEMLPQHPLTVLTFDNQTAAHVDKDYRKVGVQHRDSPLLVQQPVGASSDLRDASRGGIASHFGAKDWAMVTARKLSGVLSVLKGGKNVLFVDVDIAVARPGLVEHVVADYIDGHGQRGPDFVFQLNVRDPPPCAKEADAAKRQATRKHEPTFQNINSGFYFLRSNPQGIALLEAAISICATRGKDDQEGFLLALKDLKRAGKMRYSQDCGAFGDTDPTTLLVCTWHECEMPTGWATGRYPAQPFDPAVRHGFHWMRNASTGPYLYHPNYIAGMGNKIRKLQVKGLWVAEESRCNPQSDEF
mmetsp:Transcript_230/g.753  ORF Transcript_230/g.753 Transcript_230/m.753 type:complete len:302 (+) Transcript_230:118-1023(+)